jgi:hypothetical protein
MPMVGGQYMPTVVPTVVLNDAPRVTQLSTLFSAVIYTVSKGNTWYL